MQYDTYFPNKRDAERKVRWYNNFSGMIAVTNRPGYFYFYESELLRDDDGWFVRVTETVARG